MTSYVYGQVEAAAEILVKVSPIAAVHNFILEDIQHELRTSTEPHLMEKYRVGHDTLRTWQRWYGAKAMRFCRSKNHYMPFDRMRRNASGGLTRVCMECNSSPMPEAPPKLDLLPATKLETPQRLSYWSQQLPTCSYESTDES
jgi:hypothetical protein